MPFLTVPVNTRHQKYFEFEWLIMLFSYCHGKSVFRWKYMQKLLKSVHECLQEKGHNFLLMTCLPNDSNLEGLKNVNAVVGLLCKVDFVLHTVQSILKLTQKIISCFCHYFGRHDYFSKDMTFSVNCEKSNGFTFK